MLLQGGRQAHRSEEREGEGRRREWGQKQVLQCSHKHKKVAKPSSYLSVSLTVQTKIKSISSSLLKSFSLKLSARH